MEGVTFIILIIAWAPLPLFLFQAEEDEEKNEMIHECEIHFENELIS